MTVKSPGDDAPDAHPGTRQAAIRASRTIRFSDAEWEQVSQAAARRGIASPAEFVRTAAMAMAADDSVMARGALPPGIAEMIEHTFRGVYFLSTLRRDELIGEGRQDEVESAVQAGRQARSELLSKV